MRLPTNLFLGCRRLLLEFASEASDPFILDSECSRRLNGCREACCRETKSDIEVGCDHVTETRSLTQHQWGRPKAVFLRILGLTSEPPPEAAELS